MTMVSGGFDPLHPGHLEYFRQARALGLPVLCNVSADWDVERKHAPLLLQQERGELIDALRYIDYTHLASGTTEEVIRVLAPKVMAKGRDWEGRLPPEETATCQERGVEIVFLDTVISSSSDILKRFLEGQGSTALRRLDAQER